MLLVVVAIVFSIIPDRVIVSSTIIIFAPTLWVTVINVNGLNMNN